MDRPDYNNDIDNQNIEIRIPKKSGGFFGFLRNLVVFFLLLVIIAASFWISFLLGKRILVPVKNIPEQKIQVEIPEPPPSIAGLQKIKDLVVEDEEEVQAPEPAASKPVVTRTTVAPRYTTTTLPRSLSSSKTSDHYYKVQAGIFKDKVNAINLVKQLKTKGFDTYVKKIEQGWRVQVGAYRTKPYAINLQSSLKAKGFDSVIIYE